VQVQWTLDDDDTAEEANEIASKLGPQTQVVKVEHFLPILIPLIILAVVSAVGLAQEVWEWWDRRHKQGLLIHASSDGKVEIKPINIPFGQVIFIGADGKTFLYQDVSKDRLQEILDAAHGGIAAAGGTQVSDGQSGTSTQTQGDQSSQAQGSPQTGQTQPPTSTS
jgi:hypothetical protein